VFRTTVIASVLILASVLGCGGCATHVVTSDGAGDRTTLIRDAGPTVTSDGAVNRIGPTREASSNKAAVTCDSAVVGAPAPSTGDPLAPAFHRPAPACCSVQRGSAPPGQPYQSGVASTCVSDSQCRDGSNGRCFPFEGLVGPGGCSYDACYTDSDCPPGSPCICRGSPSDNNATYCAPAGNCSLDSDCGAGGYCSPSFSDCYQEATYYCHTARDTCTNDADCPAIDGGPPGAAVFDTCAYDSAAHHWACSHFVCLPP
jgi:hypothetical protein